jgi:hypothetical protein
MRVRTFDISEGDEDDGRGVFVIRLWGEPEIVTSYYPDRRPKTEGLAEGG